LGIDIVIHSVTKYLNGHSDVVVGVVCSSKAMIKKIFEQEYMILGAIVSPSDAALVIRGLRTLPLRMQRSFESCQKVVAFLESHPKVEKLIYPFAKSFPQYELAQRQMRGAGGLFSILLKVDQIEQVEAFFDRLQHFSFAVSWGGHESLVLPFCALYNIPGRDAPSIPWNLLRFYIGLEDPDWLIADLAQALEVL
ncbi:MAG: PLP-dependent aspartate aminotransferase family protein, partial [Saprospiraceae bacterium]